MKDPFVKPVILLLNKSTVNILHYLHLKQLMKPHYLCSEVLQITQVPSSSNGIT